MRNSNKELSYGPVQMYCKAIDYTKDVYCANAQVRWNDFAKDKDLEIISHEIGGRGSGSWGVINILYREVIKEVDNSLD